MQYSVDSLVMVPCQLKPSMLPHCSCSPATRCIGFNGHFFGVLGEDIDKKVIPFQACRKYAGIIFGIRKFMNIQTLMCDTTMTQVANL